MNAKVPFSRAVAPPSLEVTNDSALDDDMNDFVRKTFDDWRSLSKVSCESWLQDLIPDSANYNKYDQLIWNLDLTDNSEALKTNGTWEQQTLSSQLETKCPSVIVTGKNYSEDDIVSSLYTNPDVDDANCLPPSTIWVLNKILDETDDYGGDDDTMSFENIFDETYSFVGSDYSPETGKVHAALFI